ncbi:unnamed protein product, partial [Phaeothamnion confervicola]
SLGCVALGHAGRRLGGAGGGTRVRQPRRPAAGGLQPVAQRRALGGGSVRSGGACLHPAQPGGRGAADAARRASHGSAAAAAGAVGGRRGVLPGGLGLGAGGSRQARAG